MTDRPGLDFSFSGLKTQVLLAFERSDRSAQTCADIAHALQEAVADTLTIKCARALRQGNARTLVVAGGVSANRCLRERLLAMGERLRVRVCFPPPELCTDNGAMIALDRKSTRLNSSH